MKRMPTYTPTVDEMQEFRDAVSACGLIAPPGEVLLRSLKFLANGTLPCPHVPPCLLGQCPVVQQLANTPVCDGVIKSRHLAIAIAMARPEKQKKEPEEWSPADAREQFISIQEDLLPWPPGHSPAQELRKTIDQVVVRGAMNQRFLGWEWSTAADVLYYMVLVGVESFVTYVGGLIPHLDACWGEPFAETTPLHAAELRNRLLNPVGEPDPIGGSFMIQSGPNAVEFNLGLGLKPVPSGAKRTFVIRSGPTILVSPGKPDRPLLIDQRVVVRANDFGVAKVWVTKCPRGGGPVHMLQVGQTAQIVHPGGNPLKIEEWSCTCGKCHCDAKHRLSSWDPKRLDPDVSLQTWVLTAVRGLYPIVLEAFTASMYYGLLCDGE